jgi:ferredoxin--NADP+ reductase
VLRESAKTADGSGEARLSPADETPLFRGGGNMDATKYHQAKILSRRDFSADLWAVKVEMPPNYTFKPGQYATLAVEDEEGIHERAYSIVSSPLEPELEFFIELVPQGELTPRLYSLQPGAGLGIRKSAKGLFTLDRKTGHTHHLLVCTVTGVAPFVSMLRTWQRDPNYAPPETQILLIQAGSRSWEFGYADELTQLAARLPQVTTVFSVSRYWEDPAWTGERGRAEDLIRKYADPRGFTPANTTAYVCGHPNMIENSKGILQRIGFDKKSLHEEVYWIPTKEKEQPATAVSA